MERLKLFKESWTNGFEDGEKSFQKDGCRLYNWSKTCKIGKIQTILGHQYMTFNALYISDSTMHLDFFDQYSARAGARLEDIEKVDLSCYLQWLEGWHISKNTVDCGHKNSRYRVDVAFGQNLLTYSRFHYASARRVAGVDPKAATEELQQARDAAKHGADVMLPHVKQDEACVRESIVKAAQPQLAIDLHAQLVEASERAKAALQ